MWEECGKGAGRVSEGCGKGMGRAAEGLRKGCVKGENKKISYIDRRKKKRYLPLTDTLVPTLHTILSADPDLELCHEIFTLFVQDQQGLVTGVPLAVFARVVREYLQGLMV